MGMFEPIAALGPGWVFIINLACVILGGIIGTAVIVKVLRHCMKKSSSIDNAIVAFVVNAVKVACIIVLIAIVLQMFGVPMSTIVAVLGAAGAAVALALRDSLANIAGGVMIIITHPFSQGDMITIGETKGRVERIDLFLTTLHTPDYRTITIPNGIINTSVVYNESNKDIRRVDCIFSIAYGTDIEKAKAILLKVCREGELILDSPEPWIGVIKHEESGLEMECLAYCRQGDQFHAKYYLNEAVKDAFEAEGIEIPYRRVEVDMVNQR